MKEFGKVVDLNLTGTVLPCKIFTADMAKRKAGVVVNIASIHAERTLPGVFPYNVAKAAVAAMTKSMALDYAKYQIRVNAVCPAWVLTPAVEDWMSQQPDHQKTSEYIKTIHPLGYCPQGDVIADACVFLLSEKARFITGCTLPVSGGAELGYRR